MAIPSDANIGPVWQPAGAPLVPHLDTRFINGERSLLFGPFAGFSTKFLKQGSLLDLPCSVRLGNLLPMLQVGAGNFSLVQYLINQLRQSPERLEALQQFLPQAKASDWSSRWRASGCKSSKTAQGRPARTEVVAAADGSLAALLGASPGASTAVTIMLEVLERCFASRLHTCLARAAQGAVPQLGR